MISQDILEKKVTTKKIAEEYNISCPTISRWVSEYHRYGSPRIAQQLYDEGIETNKRVVAVLMRGMNLCL